MHRSITNNEIDNFFSLKPSKPAKVSEISEATAASSVPLEQRINFHIGNPVKDEKLALHYFKLVLGLDSTIPVDQFNSGEFLSYFDLTENDHPKLELLYKAITESIPYMPRGGYYRTNPNELIKYFHAWLNKNQREPLAYDLGEKSGRRECIITSGGLWESLRMLFHALNEYLINKPADLLLFNITLPHHLNQFKYLKFHELGNKEENILEYLSAHFKQNTTRPAYLFLPESVSEEIRRSLRLLALNYPLRFVELNDIPNHLSLAREAGLKDKVLRFISPAVFSQTFELIPIVFLAGNPEIIKLIETIHFQLKGTPGAAEVKFLTYLLNNHVVIDKSGIITDNFHSVNDSLNNEEPLYDKGAGSFSVTDRISSLILNKSGIAEKYLAKAADLSKLIDYRIDKFHDKFSGKSDSFQLLHSIELLDSFVNRIADNSFHKELVSNFLTAFSDIHTFYDRSSLNAVSGSSRTALSLLGFHCGFEEIITFDLSWTYEHCFPNVKVVPLTAQYEIDADKIKNEVQKKLSDKIPAKKYAVIFNNPHNATGKIFSNKLLSELLVWLLSRDVFVIDDLSYHNVLPSHNLKGPLTLKQIGLRLVGEGKLFSRQLKKIITIHSLSKTDCFAGARLAVSEILDENLSNKFNLVAETLKPNIMALLLAYLFYRNDNKSINDFWLHRNFVLAEKYKILKKALDELPADRNKFEIEIVKPEGSMYPRMIINKLPDGISLDWLSSGLAAQGIGLVPLSTFARTSKGFELGRLAFRLTLGGSDTYEQLVTKTRRVLIDLNRIIGEEQANYNRIKFTEYGTKSKSIIETEKAEEYVHGLLEQVRLQCNKNLLVNIKNFFAASSQQEIIQQFNEEYFNTRAQSLSVYFLEHIEALNNLMPKSSKAKEGLLAESLYKEFYKDDLNQRYERFKKRSYDRTVHPTQIYSLKLESLFQKQIKNFELYKNPGNSEIRQLADAFINEFLGSDVAVNSAEEAEELILDLRSLIQTELYTSANTKTIYEAFLSFWGDWDGSSRPSGQGHRLVAAAVLENVTQLADILISLYNLNNKIPVEAEIIKEVRSLPKINNDFWNLLQEITRLTNHLEKRYRSVLPFSISAGRLRSIGMKLGISKDPLTLLWQHNDGLEQRMLNLRKRRREKLEYYFRLNKKLRKTLFNLIPELSKHSDNKGLFVKTASYKDVLKRFALTPRIHQKLITAKDQFSINTTVYNMTEINELSGKYGNPGMVMGLQVSMSDSPEALISLERKLSSERERVINNNDEISLPYISCIPLMEDIRTVQNVTHYLNGIWEYSAQSRAIDQTTDERFQNIISEIFIAGSDLSQQIGQTAAWKQYNNAKLEIVKWLAEKGLAEKVRMKLGCGEPMQRQGGYYADFSSKPAFRNSAGSTERFNKYLKESTIKSTEFAKTPLHGLFAHKDLLTLQSNISEKLRFMPINERAQFLYHLKQSQSFHLAELSRAAEPFVNTRLISESRNLQELKRLTLGFSDEVYDKFVELTEKNFNNILYGSIDDVVGIHVISYFISRTTPTLRDRPTVRPSRNMGSDKSHKILEQIASTIPLSKHGSLLRAIGHNRAQSVILGINQLTTGLFRSLKEFSQIDFVQGQGVILISDKILPRLPVYEILQTLRVYHDKNLTYLSKLSTAFPAGISAFNNLREDIDSFNDFIPLFQKELLRRHGINVGEFFIADRFIADLLPTLRPDLAVLLQPDLFNTDLNKLINDINGKIDQKWLDEFNTLLIKPVKVARWRQKIWELLESPVSEQVKSFVDLAIALNTLSKDVDSRDLGQTNARMPKVKYQTSLSDLLKGNVDDTMRQFLSAAVQYLTRLPEEVVEVPIDIVRALKEVERIIKIEEQALNNKDQKLLNFYILQIARLVDENG